MGPVVGGLLTKGTINEGNKLLLGIDISFVVTNILKSQTPFTRSLLNKHNFMSLLSSCFILFRIIIT